jgi:hypothetical protein
VPSAPLPTSGPHGKEAAQALGAVEPPDRLSARLGDFISPRPIRRATTVFHPRASAELGRTPPHVPDPTTPVRAGTPSVTRFVGRSDGPCQVGDPKEAAKAVEMLEKEYPEPRPEAARVLIAILKGSQPDGTDGWFGPARTRYTWARLAERNGVEPKTGSVAVLDALDRDGGGTMTAGDLDWSDRSPDVMRANPLTRLFRRSDVSGDGKLTREERDERFERGADGKDSFTADELRRAPLPHNPARSKRVRRRRGQTRAATGRRPVTEYELDV